MKSLRLRLQFISLAICIPGIAAISFFTNPVQGDALQVGETYELTWTPYLKQEQFTHISLPGTNSSYSKDFKDMIFDPGFIQQSYGMICLQSKDRGPFQAQEVGKVAIADASFNWTVSESVESGDQYFLRIYFGAAGQTAIFNAADSNVFAVKERTEDEAEPTTSSTPEESEATKGESSSKGALIGGVVGGGVGVILLVTGAFFLGRRGRRRNSGRNSDDDPTNDPDMDPGEAVEPHAKKPELDSRVVQTRHEMAGSPTSAELDATQKVRKNSSDKMKGVATELELVSPVSPARPSGDGRRGTPL